MYLTEQRLRTLGLGIDLDGIPSVELNSVIRRATSAINAYCAVPRLPSYYSFRGGTMTDEEHVWLIDQYERPRPFQFWPWSTPVIEVIEFAIWATNTARIEVAPENLVINNSAGYVEMVALNQLSFVGAGLTPLVGLYAPIARMSYTYGHRFPVVGEVLEPVDARTYMAQRQFWTTAAVEVKVNGTVVTTGFTLDHTEGWVVFDTNQPPGVEVVASYTYSLPDDVATACGIIAARDLAERDLRAAGLGALASIRVNEVELRRGTSRDAATTKKSPAVPDDAAALLDGYVFLTAR